MAEDRKQQLLDECQSYHYQQSSNVSSLARYIIYAIIATIWFLIDEEGLNSIHCVLKGTLFSAFIYLFVDIVHYFKDAVNYRKECSKLNKEISIGGEYLQHEKRMEVFSNRSFIYLCIKFGFLILIAISFVVGMFFQLI